jgi:hypothetical protein
MKLTNEEILLIEEALQCKLAAINSALYDIRYANSASVIVDSYELQRAKYQELQIKFNQEIKSR